MRKDVRTGLFIGMGIAFVGWILLALFSDTLQERRHKQLISEPETTKPAEVFTPSENQTIQNPPQPVQHTAESVQSASAQPKELIHIVETGQTLISISTFYYGNPDQWKKILEANSDILKDPTQLRPGMRLKIPVQ